MNNCYKTKQKRKEKFIFRFQNLRVKIFLVQYQVHIKRVFPHGFR